jgi:peptide/nickel transport system ATP-binding protein
MSDTKDDGLILRVENLSKHFTPHQGFLQSLGKPRKPVKAVDGVTFEIRRGEVFGLIGESGSGKTTIGKLIMKLIEPTAGRIFFDDRDVTNLDRKETGAYRSRVQMIFQDPYASMNPRFKVRDVLAEPLEIHRIGGDREEREERIRKALSEVKLAPPQEFMDRYPHMLSGGQRQRVATARTLILNPALIVADEPVSMIDLSTRAEILHMMKDVQHDLGLTYLYITHDLSTARYFTDRIAVLYLGRVVEMGKADDVIDSPAHPYTRALIEAVPEPVTGKVNVIKELPISGEIPSPSDIPEGCRFHTRCPYAARECREGREPELVDIGGGHLQACRRWKEIG